MKTNLENSAKAASGQAIETIAKLKAENKELMAEVGGLRELKGVVRGLDDIAVTSGGYIQVHCDFGGDYNKKKHFAEALGDLLKELKGDCNE